jgi:peptidoglycan hydrolase CwlO-like protein
MGTMKRLAMAITGTCLILNLSSCSSRKEFEKMPTVEERVNKYDQKTIDSGMAVTKHGSVVDISVQDVQQQKKNLQAKVEYLEKYVAALKHDVDVLKEENVSLKAKLENCKSSGTSE